MKRTEKIEIKLTLSEKAHLNDKAKTVGTTMSTLVRKLLEDEERIVVLGEGQEILSAIYQLNAKLDQCLALKTLDHADIAILRDGMTKIAVPLCAIADSLSEIDDGEDEEETENVDS